IGCDNGLPGVEKECKFLVEQLSQYIHVDLITGRDATKAAVMHLLERPYDIVHYAGHAAPNGLSVSDGWITTKDINGFCGGGVVFINACGSGRGVTTAGLAESFISSGASAFIGNFWSVHDETAAQLALDFYMRAFQLSGACLPVGESLRRAKLKSFERGDGVWINFVLYGDPQLLLL
ncbi:MAG: CHAT domain-containing protein, partial [Candidatus Methanofastidiosia archaeon]